jgi:hypothetical protein
MDRCIEAFNQHYGTSYKFDQLTEHLAFSPASDLGDMKLVVTEAGIFGYHTPKLEGTIFEMVFKLTGGHFNTAIIGRSINGSFEPFSLQTFPDDLSIIPDAQLDKLNTSITNAIRV